MTCFQTNRSLQSVPFHFNSMQMNEWVSAKEVFTLVTNKSFYRKGFSRVWIKVGLILYPPGSEKMQKTIIGDCSKGLRRNKFRRTLLC